MNDGEEAVIPELQVEIQGGLPHGLTAHWKGHNVVNLFDYIRLQGFQSRTHASINEMRSLGHRSFE